MAELKYAKDLQKDYIERIDGLMGENATLQKKAEMHLGAWWLDEMDDLRKENAALKTEIERLKAPVSPVEIADFIGWPGEMLDEIPEHVKSDKRRLTAFIAARAAAPATSAEQKGGRDGKA